MNWTVQWSANLWIYKIIACKVATTDSSTTTVNDQNKYIENESEKKAFISLFFFSFSVQFIFSSVLLSFLWWLQTSVSPHTFFVVLILILFLFFFFADDLCFQVAFKCTWCEFCAHLIFNITYLLICCYCFFVFVIPPSVCIQIKC